MDLRGAVARRAEAMATELLPGLTLEKGDGRYYVFVDGVRAGWVYKTHEGWWRFMAPVRNAIEGVQMAEERSRRDAIAEGLSTLRVRYLGVVYDLNPASPMKDLAVFIPEDRLRELWDKLTDLKYGL